MTIVEVIIALSIMALVMGGVLATFLQSRRLAAGSIAQNCAVTIVQGYIEQIKNLPLKNFVNASETDPQDNPNLGTSWQLPTLKDQTKNQFNQDTTLIHIMTTPSTVDPNLLLNTTPGKSPAGAVDNLQSFDMDGTGTAASTTWLAIWPDATTRPTTTPGKNDLHMNFWVQITDLTPNASAKCKAYGLLVVYTWQWVDGAKLRYSRGSVRAIRSAVQTF